MAPPIRFKYDLKSPPTLWKSILHLSNHPKVVATWFLSSLSQTSFLQEWSILAVFTFSSHSLYNSRDLASTAAIPPKLFQSSWCQNTKQILAAKSKAYVTSITLHQYTATYLPLVLWHQYLLIFLLLLWPFLFIFFWERNFPSDHFTHTDIPFSLALSLLWTNSSQKINVLFDPTLIQGRLAMSRDIWRATIEGALLAPSE